MTIPLFKKVLQPIVYLTNIDSFCSCVFLLHVPLLWSSPLPSNTVLVQAGLPGFLLLGITVQLLPLNLHLQALLLTNLPAILILLWPKWNLQK